MLINHKNCKKMNRSFKKLNHLYPYSRQSIQTILCSTLPCQLEKFVQQTLLLFQFLEKITTMRKQKFLMILKHSPRLVRFHTIHRTTRNKHLFFLSSIHKKQTNVFMETRVFVIIFRIF